VCKQVTVCPGHILTTMYNSVKAGETVRDMGKSSHGMIQYLPEHTWETLIRP
jgi:hypothetical protein